MSLVTSFRHTLLHTATPAIKAVGKIKWPYTHKYLSGPTINEMLPLMQPGTILCSRIRGEPTNLLQPNSFWTHAALYLVYKDIPYVLESTSKGVHLTNFVRFVTTKDYIVSIDPQVDDDIKIRATEEGLLIRGLPYDYLLEGRNKAFYCSEVVWHSYEQAYQNLRLRPFFFVPRLRLGVPTITPQDFVDAAQNPVNRLRITYIRTTEGDDDLCM